MGMKCGICGSSARNVSADFLTSDEPMTVVYCDECDSETMYRYDPFIADVKRY
jgi:hypothetical protein